MHVGVKENLVQQTGSLTLKYFTPPLITLSFWALLAACTPVTKTSVTATQEPNGDTTVSSTEDVLDFVDPFIGTGGHGHTFPGATMPFGMVQLSPDNPSKGWDWTSGYNYSDDILLGFSHTHLSGTGVGDLLDILVTPIRQDYPTLLAAQGPDMLTEYSKSDKLISTQYSHQDETASPGYYSVDLKQIEVLAELTSTNRVGVHRYTFRGDNEASLLFNLGYAQNHDKAIDTYFKIENETTLVGYRISSGWAKHQPVYFVAQFSQPFTYQLFSEAKFSSGDTIRGAKTEAKLTFANSQQPLVAKVGLSYASIAGAKANIELEMPHFDFDTALLEAQQQWRKELAKIEVEQGDEKRKTKFYTALYHSYIAPHLFSDANNEFYGANGATAKAEDYQRYTLFSLWDTFRTLHPLFTITQTDKVDDMVKSMLAFYDESGLLPTWDLMSNETDVMIGYHAVPVLVDAYFKGLTTADPKRILQAAKASAMQDNFGVNYFKQYGYIPSDLEVEAVSKTLEYAFDDWAIARLAKHLGEEQDYQYFSQRAQAYKTLFDEKTGFMRGKDQQGNWVEPFSPTHVEHRITDYTEANAWQYTWFVPHDVPGLIELFGGSENFVDKLDELFTTSSHMEGDVSPDISGLIGQYAHGNEPCHHIPYLYALAGSPEKGEARIRQIRETMYSVNPDGLAGNDDVGQMSAWYVMSALGFYPVNPADGRYVFGTPEFSQVKVNLPQGNTLNITTKGDPSSFVKLVTLNGKKLDVHWITHEQLMQGGELQFVFNN